MISRSDTEPVAATVAIRLAPVLLYGLLWAIVTLRSGLFSYSGGDGAYLLFVPLVIPLVLFAISPAAYAYTFACVMFLELLCFVLAYYAAGEVKAVGVWLLMLANFFPAIAVGASNKRARIAGLVFAVLLAAWPIAEYVPLGNRWLTIRGEANQLVAWLEESRILDGSYPPDITEFDWREPWIAENVMYETDPSNSVFGLGYFVIQPGTSYSYEGNGEWFYYPD